MHSSPISGHVFAGYGSLFVGFLVVAMSGCGPMYETSYQLTPPKSSQGQTCVMQCENMKLQCENLAEMKKQMCEDRSAMQVERCEAEIYRKKNRDAKWGECSASQSCSDDTERCLKQYHNCYQTCGGKVKAEQVCVMNCEAVKK